MDTIPTEELREGLLGVNGIGEETADSILCYGFALPSFVIDSYTERLARCGGITTHRSGLKPLFESILAEDPHVYHQTHAHIVEYAKEWCDEKEVQRMQDYGFERIGRRLFAEHLVGGNFGNISVRDGEKGFFVKRTGAYLDDPGDPGFVPFSGEVPKDASSDIPCPSCGL